MVTSSSIIHRQGNSHNHIHSSTGFSIYTAPQAPPTNIRIDTISSEDISISWAPPTSCLDYGGPITSYIIQYQPINDSLSISKPVTTPLSNDIIMDTLSGLIPNTQYQIRIAASTDLGAGPQSHVVMATTRAPETGRCYN